GLELGTLLVIRSGALARSPALDDLTAQPAKPGLSPAQLTDLWNKLADQSTTEAYRAVRQLVASPRQAVPFLRTQLPTCQVPEKVSVEAPDPQRVQQLIVDLDDEAFAVRQQASEELDKLGESALPELLRALDQKPPLEVRHRIARLLEHIQQLIDRQD